MKRLAVVAATIFLIVPSIAPAEVTRAISWRKLQPGVEFTSIVSGTLATGAPGVLYVVRVDPAVAKLTVALASEAGRDPQSAGDWCRTSRLAVAINAGMFQVDHRSNVGYLRHGKHLNNARWNDYRSVVAVSSSTSNSRRALWLDLDDPKERKRVAGYDIVIQNLRLITTKRKNVWSASDKRWSEAALAIDAEGRLLFLFSRAPYSMREWNALLLKLPLKIAGAMHLEGGPEASLSIHAAGVDLDLAGSYETGFWPDDGNQKQWPIPNVLGVLRDK